MEFFMKNSVPKSLVKSLNMTHEPSGKLHDL